MDPFHADLPQNYDFSLEEEENYTVTWWLKARII
jgi:hypothetical protein